MTTKLDTLVGGGSRSFSHYKRNRVAGSSFSYPAVGPGASFRDAAFLNTNHPVSNRFASARSGNKEAGEAERVSLAALEVITSLTRLLTLASGPAINTRASGSVNGPSRPVAVEAYDLKSMADEELREAVDKIVDQDRLLEGEDPRTTSRAQAVHWLWVYAELLGFKRDVVDQAATKGSSLPPAALEEVNTDLKLLTAERQRLERRYKFWRSRVEELASSTRNG